MNIRTWLFTIALVPIAAANLAASQPALHVLNTAQLGTPLLSNGSFEEAAGSLPKSWSPAPNGGTVVPGVGRNGSPALLSSNFTAGTWSGASQILQLNRTETAPLIVRGWSKAQDVSGSTDSGYSLYVDIVYQDGSPLWGQTANFPTGTHDWVKRELLIMPQKPVKTLTLNCILRNHAGTALFDDVAVEELKPSGDTTLFQGTPVVLEKERATPPVKGGTVKTSDGLALALSDNQLQILNPTVAGSSSPAGFLARDVAADSDFYGFPNNRFPALSVALKTSFTAHSDHIVVSGELSDLSGKERAITLVFALPVDANGWTWGDDIRRSRPIRGTGDFAALTAVPCGAPGALSLYPLAAISGPKTGLAIGLDMGQPAVFRVGYHAGLKQLYIAYDFGLVPGTRNFQSAAKFQFVLFRFEPQWGFRAAFDKFTRIFPDQFKVRSKDQGIWMPFTDIATVQDSGDFGFKYHEGNNNVPWDDAHDVLSFRYTEPMTWWMRMAKNLPRTFQEATRIRDELAASGNGNSRQMARVSQTAAMFDESGQPALMFRNEPWCDGAVWSINPNPWLSSTSPASPNAEDSLNGATVHWNASIKENLYGPKAKGRQDGEYLDSLEGYVTADLNFRREHFATTTVPLTFSHDDHRPALFKGLAVFEFTKWLSADVHDMSKLMFANGVPYRFSFLCPSLDVMGTETDWVRNRQYEPASHSQMAYWRTLCGAKPYLLLMNTDYDAFTPAMVELYFQRSLFYGMFPSMFSHNAAENPYWQNPKWYNRDRPLFKKYQPIIKRVAEAGWQPVTLATSSNPNILLERFGRDAAGTTYLTVFNDSAGDQETTLRLDLRQLRLPSRAQATELLSNAPLTPGPEGFHLTLKSQQTKVLALPRHRLP